VGDWRADRIGSALRGENPTVLVRLESGFAVIGDTQFLPGYCLLLTDDPTADRLLDLPRPRRLAFLADMESGIADSVSVDRAAPEETIIEIVLPLFNTVDRTPSRRRPP
jgi:hypothetical protein